MSDDPISKSEMLRLRLARIGKPRSHASPEDYYFDPSNAVAMVGESRCMTCLYRRHGKVGDDCGKGMVFGTKCELFRMEKK